MLRNAPFDERGDGGDICEAGPDAPHHPVPQVERPQLRSRGEESQVTTTEARTKH